MDYQRLFEQMNPKADGESAVRHRSGIVSVVNSDGTVDVTMGGIEVPDVSVLEGVVVAVADVVQVLVWAGDLLVIGSVSTTQQGWRTWTPTLANLNVGTTGSVTAVYLYAMGTVWFDIHAVLGGTGISVGDPTFTVPVPEWAEYNVASDDRVTVGEATLIDSTVAIYDGVVTIDDGVLRPRSLLTSGTNSTQQTLSATVPITWGANDRMWLHGWYRAA